MNTVVRGITLVPGLLFFGACNQVVGRPCRCRGCFGHGAYDRHGAQLANG